MRIHIKWFYVSIIVAMIGCNLNKESFQSSAPAAQETAPPEAGALDTKDSAKAAQSPEQDHCEASS
jgi:hypothetical protein